MKVAVISSKKVKVDDLEKYMPADTTSVAVIHKSDLYIAAQEYAFSHRMGVQIFYPFYDSKGRTLVLKGIKRMITYSDYVIAFWDKKTRRVMSAAESCKKNNVPIKIYVKINREWVEL